MYKLNVSFREKEEAKNYGAKWNPVEKTWYYPGDELPEGLRRWYQGDDLLQEAAGDVLEDAPVAAGEDSIGEDQENAESFGEKGVGLDLYKTVSEVNDMIIRNFNATVEFQMIMVKGEVTNFNGHKGRNYYFAIKDNDALLPCFMWEDTAKDVLKFELKQGQQVAIIGKLDLYKAAGKSQLVVRQISDIGEGAARLALLQLKARLEAEGLFDEDHKKKIPKYPETVGIITSKDGQAIKDICKVAGKRNPYVQLVLYHVNVQGKNAVSTIVEGIKYMDKQGFDTIIVGRGGGSDEELMAYNDELIARTVYEAATPIISAVGHEGHWTLIDYVSDKRAATPSEAAEEAVPDVMVDVHRVDQLRRSLEVNMRNQIQQRKLLLQAKMAALEKNSPERRLKERSDRLALLSERLREGMNRLFDSKKHRFEVLVANLNGLSPTAKLVSGFGYISHNNKPVKDVDDVKPGDSILIRIHDGEIRSNVTEVMKQDDIEKGGNGND